MEQIVLFLAKVELMSGLNFIPVLIGLFALPEIIAFFGRSESIRKHNPLAGFGASLSDLKKTPFPQLSAEV